MECELLLLRCGGQNIVSAEHVRYVRAFLRNRCSFSDSSSFLFSAFDFEDDDEDDESECQGSLIVEDAWHFDLTRKSC